MKNENENYKELIDVETGELLKITKYQTVEQRYCIQKKQDEEKVKKFNDEFVWLLFKYGEQLLPEVSTVNMNRLIYLSTYCHEDGFLMSKDQMQSILKLSKHQWYDFWNEMIEYGILDERGNQVYINQDIVSKGTLKTDHNYTRLFCRCVRALYEACDGVKDHKALSYLYRIIPHVNRRTNIISYNPEEQDIKKIQYMTLGDFCDCVGYDRSQARRLLKELLSIKINGKSVIGFFGQDLDEKTWYLAVNPVLYYGGKNDHLYQKQKNLFKNMPDKTESKEN